MGGAGPEVWTELERLLGIGMADLSARVAGIEVHPVDAPPLGECWGTVYTMAEGVAPLVLALSAPEAVARRAAQHMLEEEAPSPQDLEECAMEFMNVLSGWVVSQLYQGLGSSVLLYPPRSRWGLCLPTGQQVQAGGLHFTTDQEERVDLYWSSPVQTDPWKELFLNK